MANLIDTIINGVARVTGTLFADKIQTNKVNAPTTAGGTTYGPGTNGQVLKSNGTTVYWGADANSGTVTSITVKATSPIAIDSTAAITTTGTRTLSHANSGVTAGTYKSVTVNATGHVTAGTNPTTLSEYGITDAKIASGVITLGSSTITPLTSSSSLNAANLTGTVPSSCYTNTTYSNFVKSGTGAAAGLVPAPSTTAGTTKYLREDGTWTVPPNTNTDTKVQSAASTVNVDEPILLNNGTSATTSTVLFKSGATINPSTGNLKITQINGVAVGTSPKFTDTVYTHPTSTGNKHIPSGGASGQFLKYSSDGTAAWSALPTASTSAAGIIQIGTGASNAAAGNHNHDSSYVKKSGDTMTGALAFPSSLNYPLYIGTDHIITYAPGSFIQFGINEIRFKFGGSAQRPQYYSGFDAKNHDIALIDDVNNIPTPKKYIATYETNGIKNMGEAVTVSQCILIDMDKTSHCDVDFTNSFSSYSINNNVFLIFECSDTHCGYSCNLLVENNSTNYISFKGMCGRTKGNTISITNIVKNGSYTRLSYTSSQIPKIGQFIEDANGTLARVVLVNSSSTTTGYIDVYHENFASKGTGTQSYNWWNIGNMCGAGSYTYTASPQSAYISNIMYTNGSDGIRRIHISGNVYSKDYE